MAATSKVLVVGELNPYGCDPEMALYHLPRHASGNRLRQHLGLSDAAYARLRKINLCTGKWSDPKGRARANAVMGQVSQDIELIVLLGEKVERAFGLKNQEWFAHAKIWHDLQAVVLPHPSGLNRVWNQPGAREKARKLLNQLHPAVPWGSTDE